MQDNADICRERILSLYDGDDLDEMKDIVYRNIICADALNYHFRFDGSDPSLSNSDILFDELFE